MKDWQLVGGPSRKLSSQHSLQRSDVREVAICGGTTPVQEPRGLVVAEGGIAAASLQLVSADLGISWKPWLGMILGFASNWHHCPAACPPNLCRSPVADSGESKAAWVATQLESAPLGPVRPKADLSSSVLMTQYCKSVQEMLSSWIFTTTIVRL